MNKTPKKRKIKAKFEDDLERYITLEDRGLTPKLPVTNDGADISRKLNPMRLAEIRKCVDCKNNPMVLLTKKKIPCCGKHWGKLADAQIGWSEN